MAAGKTGQGRARCARADACAPVERCLCAPKSQGLRRAVRHARAQNMALAVGSILALALPTLLGAIPLWLAVACHEGSTVLVALNSLRLLRWPSGLQ